MNYVPLIWELARVDFKLRYSGSLLGYCWALLKPLLTFLILNFVFANFFHSFQTHYSLNLLVGIVLWAYFTEGTVAGLNSLVAKGYLISRVMVDKFAIVVAATVQATITFAINAGIVALFFAYYNVRPSSVSLLYALLFWLLTYLLILGISLGLATLFVRYRDVNQIWEVLLTLGFFASPIIYPQNIIPSHLQIYLWINPMSYLIHYVKLALINNQFIAPSRLLMLIAVTLASVVIGSIVFTLSRRRLAEYL